MIRKNVQVATVKRAGGIDRYGKATVSRETVASRFWARLELRSTTVRAPNGDEVKIDAYLLVDPNIDIQHLDWITLDNVEKDEFQVFDVEDDLDILGSAQAKIARLVKQKKL